MMTCDAGGEGTCRWVTVEVWLPEPVAGGRDASRISTSRQVCLGCGGARLVRTEGDQLAAILDARHGMNGW